MRTTRALRRVRPAQAVGRVRRVATSLMLSRTSGPVRLVPPLNGGPYGQPARWSVSPRRSVELSSEDQRLEDLEKGLLVLAGERFDTQRWSSWNGDDLTALATYHLHYLDWVWPLVGLRDGASGVAAAVSSWRNAHPVGVAPAWGAYPASLRAWNLCAVDAELDLMSRIDDLPLFIDEHHRVIRLLLERDLGGNHLIANFKALAGIAVWRADNRSLHPALTGLDRALRRQILSDGGHEERSPAYHARVLGDLMDLDELLEAAEGPRPRFLTRAIEEMQSWLAALAAPDCSLPTFNDGDSPPPDVVSRLLPDGPSRADADLRASGFVVRRPRPEVMLTFDLGSPGPLDQPGHAHAGIGSFGLWHTGSWVLRNTGSSTYASGTRRRHERSTQAQNALAVGGQSQLEHWGAFRVGRIPQVAASVPHPGANTFWVAHSGFTVDGRRVVTRRRFEVADGGLTIEDSTNATVPVPVVARFHSVHGFHAESASAVIGPLTVSFEPRGGTEVLVEDAELASGLGRVTRGSTVLATATLQPARSLTTHIAWATA